MKLTTELVSSIFPQFTNKELIQGIAKKARLMEFEEDEIIIDPGMPIPFVPLIINGSLRVLKQDEKTGHELLLYYLKAGETCATSLSCCMHKGESEVEVISEEASTLLGIPIEYLDKWTHDYPEWREFIMLTYQKRFDELLETINSIAFSQLDER